MVNKLMSSDFNSHWVSYVSCLEQNSTNKIYIKNANTKQQRCHLTEGWECYGQNVNNEEFLREMEPKDLYLHGC